MPKNVTPPHLVTCECYLQIRKIRGNKVHSSLRNGFLTIYDILYNYGKRLVGVDDLKPTAYVINMCVVNCATLTSLLEGLLNINSCELVNMSVCFVFNKSVINFISDVDGK